MHMVILHPLAHFRLHIQVPNLESNTAFRGRNWPCTTTIHGSTPQATQGRGKTQKKKKWGSNSFPATRQFHHLVLPSSLPCFLLSIQPHRSHHRSKPRRFNPPNPNLSAGARFKCAGSAPPHADDEPRRARRLGRRPLRRQPHGLAPRRRLLGVHRRQLHRQEEGPPPRRHRGRPSRYLPPLPPSLPEDAVLLCSQFFLSRILRSPPSRSFWFLYAKFEPSVLGNVTKAAPLCPVEVDFM